MKFEIGEIAFCTKTNRDEIILDVLSGAELNASGEAYIPADPSMTYYEISTAWTIESYLRKKKPPEEEIDWVEKLELKNWNPTKQRVEV